MSEKRKIVMVVALTFLVTLMLSFGALHKSPAFCTTACHDTVEWGGGE